MEDWIIAEAEKKNVKVVFENLGEGWNGDYDPADPEDENLLRFTVYMDGEQVDDASYCTTIPATTDPALVKKSAERILSEVYNPLVSGYSIKKCCEALSWISA
ncbi:MAG: hypothetical protein IIZ93_00540 [Acidaminococcaceae bacterium]|nr:hypothetical protein [Acidaminococcaceae bacterium]